VTVNADAWAELASGAAPASTDPADKLWTEFKAQEEENRRKKAEAEEAARVQRAQEAEQRRLEQERQQAEERERQRRLEEQRAEDARRQELAKQSVATPADYGNLHASMEHLLGSEK
jgi:hypothetical protein